MSDIQEIMPLSEKTRAGYQIGGNADYFTSICNSKDIKSALDFAREKDIPYFVLGNGSNCLISDKGFRGLVISTRRMDGIFINENTIRAEAGALLSSFVRDAILAGLGGVEKLSGIPGTLGGAIYMNAGAYSQTISDRITKICIYDCDLDDEIVISKDDADFDYRSSAFQRRNCIILWAEFEFPLKVSIGILLACQNEIMQKRKALQPLEYRSCGSVFKRPPNQFAGKLIEEAGLKGFSIGDAEVSTKHANFIINKGKAKAEDIRAVIAEVREAVNRKFQILLEPEIVFVGEFDTEI